MAPGAAIVVVVGLNPIIAGSQVVMQATAIGVVGLLDVVVLRNSSAGLPNTARSDQRMSGSAFEATLTMQQNLSCEGALRQLTNVSPKQQLYIVLGCLSHQAPVINFVSRLAWALSK